MLLRCGRLLFTTLTRWKNPVKACIATAVIVWRSVCSQSAFRRWIWNVSVYHQQGVVNISFGGDLNQNTEKLIWKYVSWKQCVIWLLRSNTNVGFPQTLTKKLQKIICAYKCIRATLLRWRVSWVRRSQRGHVPQHRGVMSHVRVRTHNRQHQILLKQLGTLSTRQLRWSR